MTDHIDSAADKRTENNVVRHTYRVLSDGEKAQMLEDAEDALDAHLARARIDGISSGTERVVSGAELDKRLAALMDE